MDIVHIKEKYCTLQVAAKVSKEKITLFAFQEDFSNFSDDSTDAMSTIHTFLNTEKSKVYGDGAIGSAQQIIIKSDVFKSGLARYMGCSTFDFSAQAQKNTINDFALFECVLGPAGNPKAWRDRFALTSAIKFPTSSQWRQVTGEFAFGCLSMPFSKTGLNKSTLDIISAFPPIILQGGPIKQTISSDDEGRDGLRWTRNFWNVVPNKKYSMSPNETIQVAAQLKWIKDNSECKNSVNLKVDGDAGYIPKRRVQFNENGIGQIKVSSTGLESGDSIRLKFSTEYFSNVGTVDISIS